MVDETGACTILHTLRNVRHSRYLRLCDMNPGLNVPDETQDSVLLAEELAGRDDTSRECADLWFYSNPVFDSARIKRLAPIEG